MRADAVANRTAIVEAAWRLFSDQGPEVPMRTVAQEAGVGTGTLYRHFPDRQDLIRGVFTEVSDRIAAEVEAHLERWDADPEGAWRGFVRAVADLRTGALATQMMPVAAVDPGLMESTLPVREKLKDSFGEILARAAESGFIGQDVSPVRFHLGLAAITRPMPDKVEYLAPGQMDWLIEVYVRGLDVRG